MQDSEATRQDRVPARVAGFGISPWMTTTAVLSVRQALGALPSIAQFLLSVKGPLTCLQECCKCCARLIRNCSRGLSAYDSAASLAEIWTRHASYLDLHLRPINSDSSI